MSLKYQYRHPPYPHQRHALNRSFARPGFCLFMDAGTGKTYVVINHVAYGFEQGQLDGLLILAPNNVHVNWVAEELPRHVPERVPWSAVVWESGRMERRVNKKPVWKPEVTDLLTFPGLAVLAMNYEAVLSVTGARYIREFLRARRVLLAMDEADEYMAAPNSKRFKRIMAFVRMAAVRRPMTGTPVDEAPEHAYGLLRAADPGFWARGTPPLPTFKEFKAHIQVTVDCTTEDGHTFQKVLAHKNLDWLKDRIDSISYRYRKEDLGLPPKRYQKSFVELSPEQWRMYRELEKEYVTYFSDGRAVSVGMKLTMMLRLQQIVCGYVPPDPGALVVPEVWDDAEGIEDQYQAHVELRKPVPIPGPNLRMENLRWLMERNRVKTLIWCRFTPDVDAAVALFPGRVLRYDGQIGPEEREANKQRYLEDPAIWALAGNPRSGGRGITLINTEHVIYYSNYFSARIRSQSEDRAHRIGLQHSVLYTDLCALKTIDTYIIDKLRAKRDVARALMGDPITEWI